MNPTLPLVLANAGMIAGGAVVGLLVGAAGVFLFLKMSANSTLAAARREAEGIVSKAKGEGETHAKQIELDARNAQAQRREQLEQELDTQRDELAEKERRLGKREDTLERKVDMLTLKEKNASDLEADVRKREQAIEGKKEELDQIAEERRSALDQFRQEQKHELLRVANMNEQDAKREALKAVEQECQHEAGQLIQQITARAEEEARDNALKLQGGHVPDLRVLADSFRKWCDEKSIPLDMRSIEKTFTTWCKSYSPR